MPTVLKFYYKNKFRSFDKHKFRLALSFAKRSGGIRIRNPRLVAQTQ